MRIAQVAPLQYCVPPERAGGTERIVACLCNELVALGHSVTLFAADGSVSDAVLRCQGEPACFCNDDAGIRAVNEAAMLGEVAQSAADFDIVHCHTEYYHAAVLAPLNEKLLTTLHWRTDCPDRRRLFERFPDLQCISISNQQQVHVPRSNRAAMIHHGLPADALALGAGDGGYLAFLGRLTDQKRPELALTVATQAGMPLKLAGNHDIGNPAYFKRMIAPHLSGRHEFLGELDDSGKEALLQGAEALLMPVNWPEPFGLVVIEAMACGTPVVAWRQGSMPELIREGINGYLVDSIAEAVDAVRRCRALSRTVVREFFLANYTSERMARDHARFYSELTRRQAA